MVRSPGYPRLGNPATIARTLRSFRSLVVPIFSQSVAPSVGPAIISPIRNEYLQTELEYFSKDYDEVREMEPRPEPHREATLTLRPREGRKRGRNAKGIRPSEIEAREDESRGMNLPLLLAAHLGRNESDSDCNPPAEGISTYHPQGGIYHRLSPIMAYLHTMVLCSFADSIGSVTSFVRWIEDYPILDGLKITSHIGSYDRKGDPDNFLHLFEWAISMQKWLMPVAYHMFTYTLKEFARIWWNSQKTGSILNYEDLKAKFWSHFSQQKKFTKTHLAVHNIKQREGESTRAFVTRYTDDTLQIWGLHEEQRISGFVHDLRTRSLVEHLSTDLLSTYKGLMEKTYTWIEAREVATNRTPNFKGKTLKDREDPLGTITEDRKAGIEKAAKSFEHPPHMFGSRRSRDMSKYFHFHEYHGHDTNDCFQLRNQIEEAVKSGQLSHLMKGIKKERDESYMKNKFESLTSEGKEITFPLGGSNSSAPIVIKAKIFGREVNRVHMDSESSCEVIYEHCFMKLKSSIRASKVDSKVPLIGFSGEKSWSVRKIPLEITIGDASLTRKETLNFVIIKSDSSYNMPLGRTALQKMGIVVSTIHGAIKFHTTEGIGTVFSTYESDKYPKQTVTIGKQLSEHFKGRLRDLLRTNADVFAWTHANMTGIPRTITVKRKPFNTEHKLNEYNHVKPIKQKRRGMGLDRSTSACKEVEELTKAGILQRVKNQTWVANPFMVKKSNGGWRMCVDFTYINKVCPKDCYPLPEIDWKVESLSGF
ncbi:reverse transcriptase domain-containing protein [Tanacetum coccineum]